MTADTVNIFIDSWAKAELNGDSAFLDRVLADDFQAVGPRGFIVNRQQWLERFSTGLHYESLSIEDVQPRLHDGTAVVIATQKQTATFNGMRSDGDFRVTLFLERQADDWRILGMQLSPILAVGAA
jgi:hypothetical protein